MTLVRYNPVRRMQELIERRNQLCDLLAATDAEIDRIADRAYRRHDREKEKPAANGPSGDERKTKNDADEQIYEKCSESGYDT
jgi:hypothetical protein